MDIEKLQARLGALRAQRDQTVANANALNGAIQECEYWIAQLAPPDPPKE